MTSYRGYHPFMPKQKQMIPKPMLHDAILKGHFDIYGSSDQMDPVDDQFITYTYIRCRASQKFICSGAILPASPPAGMTATASINAMRSPKIEFILIQHPWLENDCLFADIILPVNTKFEEEDIGADYDRLPV